MVVHNGVCVGCTATLTGPAVPEQGPAVHSRRIHDERHRVRSPRSPRRPPPHPRPGHERRPRRRRCPLHGRHGAGRDPDVAGADHRPDARSRARRCHPRRTPGHPVDARVRRGRTRRSTLLRGHAGRPPRAVAAQLRLRHRVRPGGGRHRVARAPQLGPQGRPRRGGVHARPARSPSSPVCPTWPSPSARSACRTTCSRCSRPACTRSSWVAWSRRSSPPASCPWCGRPSDAADALPTNAEGPAPHRCGALVRVRVSTGVDARVEVPEFRNLDARHRPPAEPRKP